MKEAVAVALLVLAELRRVDKEVIVPADQVVGLQAPRWQPEHVRIAGRENSGGILDAKVITELLPEIG